MKKKRVSHTRSGEILPQEKCTEIAINRDRRILEIQGNLLDDLGISGLKKGMVLSRALIKLGMPDANQALRSAVLNGKTLTRELTLNHLGKWISVAIEPRAADGKITGALVSICDVTAWRINHDQQQLKEKMAHLTLLATQLANRLNTPLATILNQIGFLLLEDKSEQGQRVRGELLAIQDQVYLLSQITNALDAFAGDGGGSSKLIRIPLVLEKAVDLLRMMYGQSPIQYRLEATADLPPVFGNEIALEQCFLHLLRNSHEAIAKAGRVTIKSSIQAANRDYIDITIEDTGEGIATEDLTRVFEPFFKKKSGEHLGLGLCIAYSIIANMNGYVQLSSKPSMGTKVTVSLPVVKSIIQKG